MKITNLIKTVLTLTCLSSVVIADGVRDYNGEVARGRYFNLQQNARTFGMAGASVPTSSDSSSILGNPAGLANMEEGEVSLSYGINENSGNQYGTWADALYEENIGHALIALPVGPTANGLPNYGNIGLGWSTYDGEDDKTGAIETEGERLHLALAKSISDNTTFGYGLSYFDDELTDSGVVNTGEKSFRHTVGMQKQTSDTVKWGASLFFGHGERDVNVAGLGSGNGDSMQYGVEVGTGINLTDNTILSLAADYTEYELDSDSEAPLPSIWGGDEDGQTFGGRIGLETSLAKYLKGRLGYRYAGNDDHQITKSGSTLLEGSSKYNAVTAGLGLSIPVCGLGANIRSVNVDYGVEYRTESVDDWQHVVTTSLPFGLCKN